MSTKGDIFFQNIVIPLQKEELLIKMSENLGGRCLSTTAGLV